MSDALPAVHDHDARELSAVRTRYRCSNTRTVTRHRPTVESLGPSVQWEDARLADARSGFDSPRIHDRSVSLTRTSTDVAVEGLVEGVAVMRGVDDFLFEDLIDITVWRCARAATRAEEIDVRSAPIVWQLIDTDGFLNAPAPRAHDKRGHASRLREREQYRQFLAFGQACAKGASWICNPAAAGSIPVLSTLRRRYRQVGRTPLW